MQEEQQQGVLRAFQLVLRPIVRILLRFGISFADFAEVVKTAYVDVSSSEFGIRGRPTNISRVAVMTGLTRKEVRRIRNNLEGGQDTLSVKTTPLTEVLTRWHTESEFLDSKGNPAKLKFSNGNNSFSTLVKKYGGDVPPGAMRTELKRTGTVLEEDGVLRVVSRFVVPPDNIENLVTSLAHGVYPLLATIAKNTEPGSSRGDGNAQFVSYSLGIRDAERKRLRRISYDRLSETAVSFDDLFTACESVTSDKEEAADNPVVLVGLYYFEESDPNANYKW
ncbi:MAG: hypothetical protein K0U72_04450 [Gammaproteobacteria bacterium]|nr:hypothetical protein [Gammaproteobacteria bacterium]